MARTLLLVGTRKGCFTLESDEARRDWTVGGPFCESWPVYHAVHDPSRALGFRGQSNYQLLSSGDPHTRRRAGVRYSVRDHHRE